MYDLFKYILRVQSAINLVKNEQDIKNKFDIIYYYYSSILPPPKKLEKKNSNPAAMIFQSFISKEYF